MNNPIGISVYLQTGIVENEKILRKAAMANVDYIFSSLNIPEEENDSFLQEVMNLLQLAKSLQLSILFDVNDHLLTRLGLSDFKELHQLGVTHIRLDDGFSSKEMVDLSKLFTLVLNASTLTEELIHDLLRDGLVVSDIIACHNYYPKPYTGLSYQTVKEINDRLHKFDIQVMGFVCGNLSKRGPFYEGLPTVEEARKEDFLLNVLKLHDDTTCDIIMVGDIDITDKSWFQLKKFKENCIPLEARLEEEYSYLYSVLQHDRIDYSEYFIRSVESRTSLLTKKDILPKNCIKREVGSICISNKEYGRYQGEIELMRKELPKDSRVNVCGRIKERDTVYLDYINNGRGFILVKEETE